MEIQYWIKAINLFCKMRRRPKNHALIPTIATEKGVLKASQQVPRIEHASQDRDQENATEKLFFVSLYLAW